MKKTIMSLAFGLLMTVGVNAQEKFTVVSTYNAPAEGESYSVSSFTNNLGVMYAVANNCSVGLTKVGDDYELISRYNYSDAIFISLQAPTKEIMDNMVVGVGYSLGVWKSLSVEPNYTMPVNADVDGNREGSFNLGLSYKF
jgi:opacity protein-like surface antigen